MKLKHVFLSSLFLTTAFVACTNDDFTEISSPADTKDAISLGEGFTIVGAKTGNDAQTRAVFGEGFKAAFWEETDVVGAAWYHMVTGLNDEGEVTGVAAAAFEKKFASNTWFKWSEQVGDDMSNAKFTSDANAMAGAYVLYFPYNEKITTAVDGIPVEVAPTQTMDCENGKEMDAVNKNMVAYTVYPFVPGGTQTAAFKMNQLTNVFEIRFKITNSNLVSLTEPVKIDKVILEAVNGGSTTVLRKKGQITPPDVTSYNTDSYNKNQLGDATFGYAGITDGETDQIILNVENAGDDYKIMKLDQLTAKPFYLSALKFNEAATKVVVKILTADGQVFSKEYGAGAVLTSINKSAVEEGQKITLNVTLDELTDEGTIYTEDQFKTEWNKALAAGEATTLKIGEAVDLSAFDLALETANSDITLEGAGVTVKSLTVTAGKLTINNKLAVKGNVKVGSDAKGLATGTNGSLSVSGDFLIEGKIGELKVDEMKALRITKAGEVTLNGPADAKKSGNISNGGQLTLKSFKVNVLTNDGTVTLADANVANHGTITNKGTFDLGANVFDNNGTFNQNKTVTATTGGAFNNNAGAVLNIAATTQNVKIVNAAAASGKAAGEINVTGTNGNVTQVKSSTASDFTNNGVVNLNAYSKLEEGTANVIVLAGTINVAKDATLELYAGSALGGYVMIENGATFTPKTATGLFAATIAEEEELAGINTGVNTLFIETDLKVTTGNNASLNSKTLILKKNLVLEDDLDMSSGTGTIIVDGNVKVTGTAATKVLTLDGQKNVINKGATLTIGANAKLAAATGTEVKQSGAVETEGGGVLDDSNITWKVQ